MKSDLHVQNINISTLQEISWSRLCTCVFSKKDGCLVPF